MRSAFRDDVEGDDGTRDDFDRGVFGEPEFFFPWRLASFHTSSHCLEKVFSATANMVYGGFSMPGPLQYRWSKNRPELFLDRKSLRQNPRLT